MYTVEFALAGGETKDEPPVSDGELWLPDEADVRAPVEWSGWAEETAERGYGSAAYHRGAGFWQRASDWTRHAFAQEFERGAAFLWAPVLLGAGMVVYFNLPREPLPGAFEAVAIALLGLWWRIRSSATAATVSLALCLLVSGAAGARLHTVWVDTDMLERSVIERISGTVVTREQRADGSVRYRLRVSDGVLASDNGEARSYRLTARKGGPDAPVGSTLAGLARLDAPSGPAYPGGYDFGFAAWFDGLSGVGFFLGAPTVVVGDARGGSLERARDSISSIIRQAVPGEGGALAAALIVGDRSGIPKETTEALRQSGLAHILAISGLHMALVALTTMGGLRFGLAAWPDLALRYPIRKWAAAGGIVAATAYLALSGLAISSQRAWIMTVIMLGAIVLDRKALTMRNVALAALVVLALSPHAVLSAGFQMSFAAVAALVASYEILRKWTDEKDVVKRKPGWAGMAGRIVKRDVGGLAMTSLIAGVATALFAAYHFQRIAPMGLFANLAAMPVVSFAVMPLAVVSAIAMPFGLEAWPLAAMAVATDAVVSVATWFSAQGPTGETGRMAVGAFLLATTGLLIVTLSRTGLKVLALVPFAAAATIPFGTATPDILIAQSGAQVAVFAEERMVLARPKAENFVTNIWSKATGTKIDAAQDGFTCDADGCSQATKEVRVVMLKTTRTLHQDCAMADIIVARFPLPSACQHIHTQKQPLVLDSHALRRGGSRAVTFAGSELQVERAVTGNARPWNRHRFVGSTRN